MKNRRFVWLFLVLTFGALFACKSKGVDRETGTQDNPSKSPLTGARLTFRVDAVEPPGRTTVWYSVAGVETTASNVAPGTLFDVGRVAFGTQVSAKAFNINGAGFIRIHILTENCFRRIGSCGDSGCVAEAHYIVTDTKCEMEGPERNQ